MERWLPKGGASPQPDGAFERFLTAAIATIITIMFSWRLLDNIDKEEEDENEPGRHKLGYSSPSSLSSSYVSFASPYREDTSVMSTSNSKQVSGTRSQRLPRRQDDYLVQKLTHSVPDSASKGLVSGGTDYNQTRLKPAVRVPVDLPLCGDDPSNFTDVRDAIYTEAPGVWPDGETLHSEQTITANRSNSLSQPVGLLNSHYKEKVGGEYREDTNSVMAAFSHNNYNNDSLERAHGELVDITDSSLEDVEFIGVEGNSDLFLNLSSDSGGSSNSKEEYRQIINNENYKPFHVRDDSTDNRTSDDYEDNDDFFSRRNDGDDFEDDGTEPRELDSGEQLFCCSMLEPITEEDSDDMTDSNEEDSSRSDNGLYSFKKREVEYDIEHEEKIRGLFSDNNNLTERPIYNVKNSTSFGPNKNISFLNRPSRTALTQRPVSHIRSRLHDLDKQKAGLTGVNSEQATGPDYEAVTGSVTSGFTCGDAIKDDGSSVSNALDNRECDVNTFFHTDDYYEYIRRHGSSVDRLSPTHLNFHKSKETSLFLDSNQGELHPPGKTRNVNEIFVRIYEEGDQGVPHSFVGSFSNRVEDIRSGSKESLLTSTSAQISTELDVTPVIGQGLTSGLRPVPVKTKRPVSDGFAYITKRRKSEEEKEAFFRDRVVSEGGGVAFGEERSGEGQHDSVPDESYLDHYDISDSRFISCVNKGDSYTLSGTDPSALAGTEPGSVFHKTDHYGSSFSRYPRDINKQTSATVELDNVYERSPGETGLSEVYPGESPGKRTNNNSCDLEGTAVKSVSGAQNRSTASSCELTSKPKNSRFVNSQISRENTSKTSDDKMDGREYYPSDSFDRVSDRNDVSDIRDTEEEETEWEEEIVETFVLPVSHERTILRTLQSVKDLLDQRSAARNSDLIPRDDEDDVDEAGDGTCVSTMIKVDGHDEMGYTGNDDVTSGYRDKYNAVARTDRDLKEKLGFELNLDEFKTDEYNTESGWPIVRYIEKERFYVDDNGLGEIEYDRVVDRDVKEFYADDEWSDRQYVEREMGVVAEEDEEQEKNEMKEVTEDDYGDEEIEEEEEEQNKGGEQKEEDEEAKNKQLIQDYIEDQQEKEVNVAAYPAKTEHFLSVDLKQATLQRPAPQPPVDNISIIIAQRPQYQRIPSEEQFSKLEYGDTRSPTLSIPPSPVVKEERASENRLVPDTFSSGPRVQGDVYTVKSQSLLRSFPSVFYTDTRGRALDEFTSFANDLPPGVDYMKVDYEDFVREMSSKDDVQSIQGPGENYPNLTPDLGSAILSGNLATPHKKKDVFVFPKEEQSDKIVTSPPVPFSEDNNEKGSDKESEARGGKRSEENEKTSEQSTPVKKPRLVRTSTAQDEEELLGFKSGQRRSSSGSLYDEGILNRSFEETSSSTFAFERFDSEPGGLSRSKSRDSLSRSRSREAILPESPNVEYRHFPESPRKFYSPKVFGEPMLDVVLESSPFVTETSRTGSSSTDSAPITPVSSRAKENQITPLPVRWTRVIPGSNFVEEKRSPLSENTSATSVNSRDTVDGGKTTTPVSSKVNQEDIVDLEFADADDSPEHVRTVPTPADVLPAITPPKVRPTPTPVEARPVSIPPKPPLAPKPRTVLPSFSPLKAPPTSAVKTSVMPSSPKSSPVSNLQQTVAACTQTDTPPVLSSPKSTPASKLGKTVPASTVLITPSVSSAPKLTPASKLEKTVPASTVIITPSVSSATKSTPSSNLQQTPSAQIPAKEVRPVITPAKPSLAPKPRKTSAASVAMQTVCIVVTERLSPTFSIDRMEEKIELVSPTLHKSALANNFELQDEKTVEEEMDFRDGKVDNGIVEDEKVIEEEIEEDEESSEEEEEEDEEEEEEDDSDDNEEHKEEEADVEKSETREQNSANEVSDTLKTFSLNHTSKALSVENTVNVFPRASAATSGVTSSVTSSNSAHVQKSPTTPSRVTPLTLPSLGTTSTHSQFLSGSPRKPRSMKEIKKRYKQQYKSVLTQEPTTPTSPKVAPFVLPENLMTPSRLKIIQSRDRFLSEQNWLSDPFAREFAAHKAAMAQATAPSKDRKYTPKMSKHPNYRSQEQLEKIMYMINLKHGRSEGSLHTAHNDSLHDDCILSEKGRRQLMDKALSIDSLHADLYRYLQRFDSETDTDGGPLSDAYFPETNSDLFDLTFPFQSDGGRYLERPASMSELRHASDYTAVSGSGSGYFDTPESKGKGRFTQRPYKKSKSLCTLETNLDDVNFATSPTDDGLQRVPSVHELRISKSLQKLNVPNWYKQSSLSKSGSCLLKYGSNSSMSSWAFSPSLISSPCTTPSTTSNVVIKSRVQLPTSSRNLRSPRFTSKSAPSTPSFLNQSEEETPSTSTPVKLPSEKMRSKDKPKALMPIPIVPFDKIRAMFEKNKEDVKTQKSQKEESHAPPSSQPSLLAKAPAQRPTVIMGPPKTFAVNGDEVDHPEDVIPKVIVSPTDPNVKSILKRSAQEKRYSDIQEAPEADDEPTIVRPVPTKPHESAPTVTLSQAPVLISPPQPQKQQPPTKPPIKQKPVPPERTKPGEFKSLQATKDEQTQSAVSREQGASLKQQKDEKLQISPVAKPKGFTFFKSLRSSSSSSTEDVKDKGRKSPREKGHKPSASPSVSADSSYDSPDAFPASPASKLSPAGVKSPPSTTIKPETPKSKGSANVNVAVDGPGESTTVVETAPVTKPLGQKQSAAPVIEEQIAHTVQAVSRNEPSRNVIQRKTVSPESVQETNLDDSFETEVKPSKPEPTSQETQPDKKRLLFPKSKSSKTSKSPEEPSKLTSKPKDSKVSELQSKFEIQQLSDEPRRLRSPVELTTPNDSFTSEGSKSGYSQRESDRSRTESDRGRTESDRSRTESDRSRTSASFSEDSRSRTRESDLDQSRDSYSSRSGDRSREFEKDNTRDPKIPDTKPSVEADRSFTRSLDHSSDSYHSRDIEHGSIRSGGDSQRGAPVDDRSRSSGSVRDGRYISSEDDRRGGSRDREYDRDIERRGSRDYDRRDREYDSQRDYDRRDYDRRGSDYDRDRDYHRRDVDYGFRERDYDGRDRRDRDHDRQYPLGRRDRDGSAREGSIHSRELDSDSRQRGDLDRSSLSRGSAIDAEMSRDSRLRRPSDNYEDTTSRSSLSSGRTWQPKSRGSRGSDSSAVEENSRTTKPSLDSNGTSSSSSPYRYRVAGSAFSASRPNAVSGLNTPPPGKHEISPTPKPDASAGASKSLKEFHLRVKVSPGDLTPVLKFCSEAYIRRVYTVIHLLKQNRILAVEAGVLYILQPAWFQRSQIRLVWEIDITNNPLSQFSQKTVMNKNVQ